MSGAEIGSCDDAQPASSSSSPSSNRFRLLHSLRNMLFGRRRRDRRTVHNDVVRVKSSYSLDDELKSTASTDSDGSHPVSASLSSTTPSTDIIHPKPLYNKFKSISTGDLLDTSSNATHWLLKCTPSDIMERRVPLLDVSSAPEGYHFTDLTRLYSNQQTPSVSSIEDISDLDFFSVGWLETVSATIDSADGSHEEHYVVDNLDVVPWRQSLDVTVLKDRLAVKQKGKRQTAAVQCKLNTAHHAQGLDRANQMMLDAVPENVDSDVIDSAVQGCKDAVVTCNPTSRDGDVTSASVPGRSCSDSGTSPASARSVVSPPAAAAGRGRLLITDGMLTDAIRRVRPTGVGVGETGVTPSRRQKCGDVQGRNDGAQSTVDERSPAAGRRLKPRPVTMAPTGGSG